MRPWVQFPALKKQIANSLKIKLNNFERKCPIFSFELNLTHQTSAFVCRMRFRDEEPGQ
jgi:hypothetical protein